MPPRIRYSKEAIIDAAYELTRSSGWEEVNARAVAAALGCSTQPIFRVFRSMDELKVEALKRANAEYVRRMEASSRRTDMPLYKAAGMAYILFAREEPQLFRLLYMRDCENDRSFILNDPTLDHILDVIVSATGYTRETAREFHLQMWVYAHGLATMVVTNYVRFTDEELSMLLSRQFEAGRLLCDKKK